MKSIVFKNKGVIDLRAIKTFGISAKVGENPIGFFGTGLKYAIAILLREKMKVILYADGVRFDFTRHEIDMRGKKFEIIKMNEYELPFTTELGKNWLIWQAFRELYCNCLDESGEIYSSNEDQSGEPGETKIVVTGEAFSKCYADKDQYFLNIPDCLRISDGKVEIYDRPSDSIYYRGIKVHSLGQRSIYTYNFIDDVDLTEDRTLKYLGYTISQIVRESAAIKSESNCKKLLTAIKGTFEYDFNFMDYFSNDVASPQFLKTLEALFNSNTDLMNASARRLQAKITASEAVKSFDEASLNPVEQMQLDRANRICKQIWKDFDKYPLIVVETLGESTMAMADMDKGRIIVSKKSFALGSKFLISTLIEEYTHLTTGFGDNTRELQTHLFDTICTMIENHVIREPM